MSAAQARRSPGGLDAAALLAAYRSRAGANDATRLAPNSWDNAFVEAAAAGDLPALAAQSARAADDIGASFRVGGMADRRRPLSPLPLLLDHDQWQGIAAGVVQRATLIETLLADIYGAQRLVGNGLVPAALLNGSPHFLRPVVGVTPPGSHYLNTYAADLVLTADRGWQVAGDLTRAPLGLGQALENRLALSRVLPGLQARLAVERLAPFFADLRKGLASACRRSEPRIALLTGGRDDPGYAEQAHLARYLGLLLVEGEDLATYDDRLYLRTIEGFKRVDALWRRIDARLIDPLAFDSTSRVGIAGLIDSYATGNVVIANAPGAGVIETAAFAALLPRLALRMTGEALRLPGVEAHWCGEAEGRAAYAAAPEAFRLVPAFDWTPPGPPNLDVRGVDYIARAQLSPATMPVVLEGELTPRPFTLRIFATRDAEGGWRVMPGGLVRIGESHETLRLSADTLVIADHPVAPVTLISDDVAIRRNPGTLPSRVADNFYWLGRYLERAEAVLAMIRGGLGGSADVDGGAALGPETAARLDALLIATGAADAGSPTLGTAFADNTQPSSVATLLGQARTIGAGSRERLAADVWRLLDLPLPASGPLARRATELSERFAAIAGLASESMSRSASWRFLDTGRRLERALSVCRLLRAFDVPDTTSDDLALLLDLTSSAISYRQRYPTGLSARAVRDLIALDASNPRSLAYQLQVAARQLERLPRLSDDGVAEPQQIEVNALGAQLAALGADSLDSFAVQGIENRLLALHELIGKRYFLRGGEPLRAPGLTLA